MDSPTSHSNMIIQKSYTMKFEKKDDSE